MQNKNLREQEFTPTTSFFLELLDQAAQNKIEFKKLANTQEELNFIIENANKSILNKKEQIDRLNAQNEFAASDYQKILALLQEIKAEKAEILQSQTIAANPYFARLDLIDNFEKYSINYIGKKGNKSQNIIDWRTPVAKKYYQKSNFKFNVNEFSYKVILRRLFNILDGKLEAFSNEYLNLNGYLTKEQIGSQDESTIFDPFLKQVLKDRKNSHRLMDIIQTIQEMQYDIITKPAKQNIIVSGCAGSGKTMVMLHRLSYIMYNDESIKPKNILVLTPSVAFNAFIDKLCQVLEIERVKTQTVQSYFESVLKARGIDFTDKISTNYSENIQYLQYLYSPRFEEDAKHQISRLILSVKDFFISREFFSYKVDLISALVEAVAEYKKIANAPRHIIRLILGEVKLTREKSVVHTRNFRYLLSHSQVVLSFLQEDLSQVKFESAYYFLRRFREFFESFKYIAKNYEKTISIAVDDIAARQKQIKGELASIYLNIAKRQSLEKEFSELDVSLSCVQNIEKGFVKIYDLGLVLKTNSIFVHLGNSKSDLELAKFLHAHIIKPIKIKFKTRLKMYKSDVFALLFLLNELGVDLKLGQSYCFIDEGQDLSLSEYKLIRCINNTAAINLFGDPQQNISKYKGMNSFNEIATNHLIFTLNQNYRNTNQIIEFVHKKLGIGMQAIGVDGPSVACIAPLDVCSFLSEKEGLLAIIANQEILAALRSKNKAKYNLVQNGHKIAANKINLLTPQESKGLEFSAVVVFESGLDLNQKYVAFTRALSHLAVVGEEYDV